MYNNNIRTDSEIHKFINFEFRNYRLRLEWPLLSVQRGKNGNVQNTREQKRHLKKIKTEQI